MRSFNAWMHELEGRKSSLGKDSSLVRLQPIATKLGLTAFPCQVIKIAGTNGKGSAAVSLTNIYHELGYKTACYTSPHLFRFNERLKINNAELEDVAWCEAFNKIASFKSADSLSYFDFITLAALLIISRQQLDVIILEIGMGGRLDTVNIVDADIAFITSIGMDHSQWLGNTLGEIAAEKAGITINSKQLVCTARTELTTIINIAKANKCNSYILAEDFNYQQSNQNYSFNYQGDEFTFRAPNIHPDIVAGVLMCLILGKGSLNYNKQDIVKIFPNIVNIGRCNNFDIGHTVLVDVAHNVASAKYLLTKINAMQHVKKIHMIFSCIEGKDIANIVKLFSGLAVSWHIYEITDIRAMPLSKIQKHLCATAHNSALEAFKQAVADASDGDLIVAFGSFHVAKDILLILNNHSSMVGDFRAK